MMLYVQSGLAGSAIALVQASIPRLAEKQPNEYIVSLDG
jgi:hypothetical protein